MGWGRFLLLGDIGQQLDIGDREREMAEFRERIRDQRGRDEGQDTMIQLLRAENEELKLYVGAIVRLLRSKQVVSDEEVKQIVDEVEQTSTKRP